MSRDTEEEEVDLVMEVLDIHRWKTFNGSTLMCECGAQIGGDRQEAPEEFFHSPLDDQFRRHIAELVVQALHE